jgi:hypothetical protein
MPAPKLTNHSPAGDPIKSRSNVQPEVSFDGSVPVDPGTVQFTLKEKVSGNNVVGQWWFRGVAPDLQWVFFTPSQPLKINTYYTASVRISSIDGTPMPAPFTWDFEVKSA